MAAADEQADSEHAVDEQAYSERVPAWVFRQVVVVHDRGQYDEEAGVATEHVFDSAKVASDDEARVAARADPKDMISLYLSPIRAAETVEDALEESGRAIERLKASGLFERVAIELDVDEELQREQAEDYTGRKGLPLNLRVRVMKGKRKKLNIGTETGPGLGSDSEGVLPRSAAELEVAARSEGEVVLDGGERLGASLVVSRGVQDVTRGMRSTNAPPLQQDDEEASLGLARSVPTEELFGGDLDSLYGAVPFQLSLDVSKPLHGLTWNSLMGKTSPANECAANPVRHLETPPRVHASFSRSRMDRTQFRGYSAEITGGHLRYESGTGWAVQYGASLRDIFVAPRLSREIREAAAGSSVKSSILAEYTYDSRDDPAVPERGWYGRVSQEFAGLGGDAKFSKTELTAQLNRTALSLPGRSHPARQAVAEGGSRVRAVVDALTGPARKFTFQTVGRAGFLLPLGQNEPTRSVDRFMLDTAYLRGFQPFGVGPRASCGTAMGGNVYLAAGTHVSVPLLRSEPEGGSPSALSAHLHAFHNCGSIVPLAREDSFSDAASNTALDLRRNFRHTVGTGLVVRLPFGRAEFNYVMPLAQQPQDRFAKWQLSFMLSL